MTDTNFVWSDELVKEFLKYRWDFTEVNYAQSFKDFKKLKEKDIPKDFHVVSYIFEGKPVHADFLIGNPFASLYPIHSVQRESDAEIFEVRDKFLADSGCELTIKSFEIENAALKVYSEEYGYWRINEIKHPPKPKVLLFTTEDGVEIFEGDNCHLHIVDNETFCVWSDTAQYCENLSDRKYFFDLKKRTEYMLHNKPIKVSYNEMIKLLDSTYNPLDPWSSLMEAIKEVFKSKINQ